MMMITINNNNYYCCCCCCVKYIKSLTKEESMYIFPVYDYVDILILYISHEHGVTSGWFWYWLFDNKIIFLTSLYTSLNTACVAIGNWRRSRNFSWSVMFLWLLGYDASHIRSSGSSTSIQSRTHRSSCMTWGQISTLLPTRQSGRNHEDK